MYTPSTVQISVILIAKPDKLVFFRAIITSSTVPYRRTLPCRAYLLIGYNVCLPGCRAMTRQEYAESHHFSQYIPETKGRDIFLETLI